MKTKEKYELVSKQCVNSKWIASFLATDGQEYCECGFCKVKVKNIDRDYDFIVTEKEINMLLRVDDLLTSLTLPIKPTEEGKK